MNQIAKNETNRIARRTFRTFTSLAGKDRLSTWGACHFRASNSNGKPSLQFDVEGIVFRGTVELSYDRNCDLYDVNLIKDGKRTESHRRQNIYLIPSLINILIEQPLEWDDETYTGKIYEWKN